MKDIAEEIKTELEKTEPKVIEEKAETEPENSQSDAVDNNNSRIVDALEDVVWAIEDDSCQSR